MGMTRLVAVAVVALTVCAGAGAQRGGGGHAGGGGGFHGGGGFVSHGGGRGRVGGATGGFSRPVNRVGGGSYAPRNGGQGRGFGAGQGVASGRPEFYHRGGDRRRGTVAGYGYGYGGVGYGDYGYLDANDSDADAGYGGGYDSGPADNGAYDAGPVQDGAGGGANGYGPQGPRDTGQADGGEEPPVPYVAGTAGGSSAGSGVRRPVGSQASLYNSDAVTLVFKDGRAQEKIHNYALTRTTLYVTDGRRREIPIASLDLVETEKANRADGVRFQLPGAQ